MWKFKKDYCNGVRLFAGHSNISLIISFEKPVFSPHSPSAFLSKDTEPVRLSAKPWPFLGNLQSRMQVVCDTLASTRGFARVVHG